MMNRRAFLRNTLLPSVLVMGGIGTLTKGIQSCYHQIEVPITEHVRHGLFLQEPSYGVVKLLGQVFEGHKDIFYGDGINSKPMEVLTLKHQELGVIQFVKDVDGRVELL